MRKLFLFLTIITGVLFFTSCDKTEITPEPSVCDTCIVDTIDTIVPIDTTMFEVTSHIIKQYDDGYTSRWDYVDEYYDPTTLAYNIVTINITNKSDRLITNCRLYIELYDTLFLCLEPRPMYLPDMKPGDTVSSATKNNTGLGAIGSIIIFGPVSENRSECLNTIEDIKNLPPYKVIIEDEYGNQAVYTLHF